MIYCYELGKGKWAGLQCAGPKDHLGKHRFRPWKDGKPLATQQDVARGWADQADFRSPKSFVRGKVQSEVQSEAPVQIQRAPELHDVQDLRAALVEHRIAEAKKARAIAKHKKKAAARKVVASTLMNVLKKKTSEEIVEPKKPAVPTKYTELDVMHAIAKQLLELDPTKRKKVLRWVTAFIEEEEDSAPASEGQTVQRPEGGP
jgi:hypothetical protein